MPVKCTTANILKEGAGAALVSGDCQLYTNCPSHTRCFAMYIGHCTV